MSGMFLCVCEALALKNSCWRWWSFHLIWEMWRAVLAYAMSLRGSTRNEGRLEGLCTRIMALSKMCVDVFGEAVEKKDVNTIAQVFCISI